MHSVETYRSLFPSLRRADASGGAQIPFLSVRGLLATSLVASSGQCNWFTAI